MGNFKFNSSKIYVAKIKLFELEKHILSLLESSPLGCVEQDNYVYFYFSSVSESILKNKDFHVSVYDGSMFKKSRKIIRISPRLRLSIIDDTRSYRRPLNRWINILRGSAFGTGEHPTTRRILYYLAKLTNRYRSALDFGAGSGILGLAYERLFNGRVFFVENDPLAVKNLEINILLNKSKGKICSLLEVDKVDLILANIYFSTLMNNYELLKEKGSKLIIFSGLRSSDDLELIFDKFEVLNISNDNTWISCVGKFKV